MSFMEYEASIREGLAKKHIARTLLWMLIVFEFGVFVGVRALNAYYDHRIRDSIQVGSFLYDAMEDDGTFIDGKKNVYIVRRQVIDVYVPKVEKTEK